MSKKATASEPVLQRIAVVVGANDPARSDVHPLEYADDDAVRNEEVLQMLGAETFLVTTIDPDTARLYAGAVRKARRSTRTAVLEALANATARAKQLATHGAQVELYFFFTGHGGPTDGNWSLYLDGGEALTASDLDKHLLRPASDARVKFTHVILDACNSSGFVGSRGPSPQNAAQRAEVARRKMHRRNAERIFAGYPGVGLLWAQTEQRQVFEWSEYRGGLFGHQVRSALLNAADATGDGRVTYRETQAFVLIANQDIEDASARMNPRVQLPQGIDVPLAVWGGRAVAELELEPGPSDRHIWISEERPLPGGDGFVEVPLLEALREGADRVRLFVNAGSRIRVKSVIGQEAPVTKVATLEAGSRTTFARLDDHPPIASLTPRGAPDPKMLKEGLFKTPFGRKSYRVFITSLTSRPREDAPQVLPRAGEMLKPTDGLDPWPAVLIGAAAVVAGVGLATHVISNDKYEEYQAATSPQERSGLRSTTETLDWTATVSFVTAGVLGALGLGLLAYDNASGPAVQMRAGPAEASRRASVAF